MRCRRKSRKTYHSRFCVDRDSYAYLRRYIFLSTTQPLRSKCASAGCFDRNFCGRRAALDGTSTSPEGVREINELHVPVALPWKHNHDVRGCDWRRPGVSREKGRSMLPGRYTSLWFQATKTGTYHIFCGQYWGASHAQMIGWVYVMEPSDAAWLSGGASHESWRTKGCSRSWAASHATRTRTVGIYGKPQASATWKRGSLMKA